MFDETNVMSKLAGLEVPEPVEPKEEYLQRLSDENPNRFSAWYPKVNAVCDTPETLVLPFTVSMLRSIVNEDPDSAIEELEQLVEKIHEFAEEHGYPVFLKNGLFSSKHDWQETCCVYEDSDLLNHICRIVYTWEMVGNSPSLELVVRKMIKTEPICHAFHGRMPITREFRFFSSGGTITGYQPYWPQKAIEDHSPDQCDWQARLQKISQLTAEDEKDLVEKATSIAKALTGAWNECPEKVDNWSIDLLQDAEGDWWMIDAAQEHQSYKMTEDEGLVIL